MAHLEIAPLSFYQLNAKENLKLHKQALNPYIREARSSECSECLKIDLNDQLLKIITDKFSADHHPIN